MIDQQIARQPRQPCAERPLRGAKGSQGAKYPQKNLLRQILRLRSAAGEPVTKPVHSSGVLPDQFLP
jgi:hypothetical protein